MPISLRKDPKSISKYIAERVQDYPLYVNAGPGEDDDPITQIMIGYSCDQDAWIALVFDTRPKPAFDGEWTRHLDENMPKMPHWLDGVDRAMEKGLDVKINLPDSGSKVISQETDFSQAYSEIIGPLVRDALLTSRSKKVCSRHCRWPRIACWESRTRSATTAGPVSIDGRSNRLQANDAAGW